MEIWSNEGGVVPFSEPPPRCYISTGGSGNLPPVFVNSIFHVFTYLYSSHVQARARALCQPEFCVFLRTFLEVLFLGVLFAVLNESLCHLSGSVSGICLQPY